jgi:hypothetical protein
MLEITARAREHLHDVLTQFDCIETVAVRFLHSGQIMLDECVPADTVFYHDGRRVLLLDSETARLLQGSRMDLDDDLGLERLRLSRTPLPEDSREVRI